MKKETNTASLAAIENAAQVIQHRGDAPLLAGCVAPVRPLLAGCVAPVHQVILAGCVVDGMAQILNKRR